MKIQSELILPIVPTQHRSKKLIKTKLFPSIKKGGVRRDKTIEVLVVPSTGGYKNQKNVAITIDPDLICTILRKGYSNVLVTEIKTMSCLIKLAERHPDLVFSGVKYFDFDEGQIWLNDFLDQHKISYIGSNHAALNNEHDKVTAKKLVCRSGVATADYFTTDPGQKLQSGAREIPYPVFIKPVKGGDSIGVDALSIAFNKQDMDAKIKQIFDTYQSPSLVEKYLSGREYSVGILEDEKTKVLTAMPIEIITGKNKDGHRILDFDVKKTDQERVKKVLDENLHGQLSEMGKSVFKILGGKSFGRIDIKLCGENIPHFMEANLMPGLSKGYFFRSCALNLGIGYEQMILLIAGNRLTD